MLARPPLFPKGTIVVTEWRALSALYLRLRGREGRR